MGIKSGTGNLFQSTKASSNKARPSGYSFPVGLNSFVSQAAVPASLPIRHSDTQSPTAREAAADRPASARAVPAATPERCDHRNKSGTPAA